MLIFVMNNESHLTTNETHEKHTGHGSVNQIKTSASIGHTRSMESLEQPISSEGGL